MNYILQLNGFWNWVRTNEISHLEVDLYLSILDIANTSSWKTCFTIPNSTLGRFDKNSLTRARNKLVQYGLIQYDKGRKGQAPTYQVTALYDNTNPKFDTYIDTNIDTNSDTNMQPIRGTYINKNKTKRNNIPPVSPGSKKNAKPAQEKKWFAEFVTMTNDEYAALVEKYGESDTKRLIEILDNYKGANGKTYTSDYRAILNWVVKRLDEEKSIRPAGLGDRPEYDELAEIAMRKVMDGGQ